MDLLQWGRDQLIAELPYTVRSRPSSQMASMGPRSIDRGIFTWRGVPTLTHLASMGPRSIDRGITATPTFTVLANSLQWGRNQLIAELSRSCGSLPSGMTGFNGAAIN